MTSLKRIALVGLAMANTGFCVAASTKPNFVFIMTDDQDLHLSSLDYQPLIKKHLTDEGTTFNKHYCTVSLCCPSRVSLLTGKAAHNTNVTDVALPYGGYEQFINNGLHEKYLPVWLQEAGYNTYYTGKLMNGFKVETYNNPYPAGWTETDFLIDPQTYWYYNSSMSRNNETYRYLPGNYSTDVVASSALEFLDTAIAADSPFFVGVTPIGPHAEMQPSASGVFQLPTPADRHKDLFPNITAPRTASFNKLRSGGASYLSSLPELNATEIEYIDLFYRRRIQSLQSIDELVESVVTKLSAHPDVLANTYIIYTSDNGFHLGQHRLAPGKTCNIEEDINVPFVVRGPGVAKGATYNYSTTHTDIVPTLFQLANITLHDDFDGEPIPVTTELQQQLTAKSEHVNVEYWGTGITEGTLPNWISGVLYNNTYKHVRVIADAYDLSYTVWCTNEHELFDLTTDPFQMTNLYAQSGSISGYNSTKLTARLDALLLTLKSCKGRACSRPWETLHPQGDVASLADAMNAQYDEFYLQQQLKVSFSACADGHLTQFEGALEPVPYGGADVRRLVKNWEMWS
ncbi:arylsulfatase precursor [Pseudomassariella vexata]|uniref:Arylsulfatase n=1 Tax=Pseudomassariella vexata TaxID=1141098 RepID=A0A1Y2DB02_9PEZI|nr:arylsulfatase precursor [Pseudomassariella vexata]ORY55835.1 arylsulfatase precursor [Pseudomassariella vexata]